MPVIMFIDFSVTNLAAGLLKPDAILPSIGRPLNFPATRVEGLT